MRIHPTAASSLSLLAGASLLLSACAPPVYYDQPKEWVIPGGTGTVIEQYRPYLTGRRIFIDPGHGGEDRFGRGPTETAIEADVNLNVALELRSFLEQAGATVILSRQADSTVSLRNRPLRAVASGAEIFVSLHHNDTGTRDNITNYTSVYYHSVPGRLDYHPANHDLARYIERDVAYAMRNPEPPYSPTFDGTLSDFDIYPNAGFAVLRENPLPAVLVEGSFFSHPREEQRLGIREFNRIEAWGIFIGLGKYFRAGIPELKLLSDTIQRVPRPLITLLAGPRETVDGRSVAAWFDTSAATIMSVDTLGVITIAPPADLISGDHRLRVELRNKQGNASWPFEPRLVAMLPIASMSLSATPSILPPDPRAICRITCRAFDAVGNPVANGSIVVASFGKPRVDTVLRTVAGKATLDLRSGPEPLAVRMQGDGKVDSIRVPIRAAAGMAYVCGVIRSASDSLPIGGSAVRWSAPGTRDSSTLLASGDDDGRFFAYRELPDSLTLIASARGYFSNETPARLANRYDSSVIALTPIASGVLFGDLFLLDPRFGGTETGDASGTLRSSDLNLSIARRLATLLGAAGANVVLVRDRDTTISERERAQYSGRYGRGIYLRIDASGRAGAVSSEIHSSIPNRNFAGSVLRWAHRTTGLDSTAIAAGEGRFYRDVAQATISIIVPSVTTGYYDTAMNSRIDDLAWGMFLGTLENAGFTGIRTQAVRILSTSSGTPVADVAVTANDVLSRRTDQNGVADFFGLLPSGSFLQSEHDTNVQLLQPER